MLLSPQTVWLAATLRPIVKQHPHKSPHILPASGVSRGTEGLEVFERFGSSGRTRTYNPSVNSRMACSCLTWQLQDLDTSKLIFVGNWGDSRGTLERSTGGDRD